MKSFALPLTLILAAASTGNLAQAQISVQQVLTDASEIHTALSGKLVYYSPAGLADAGIAEEFHADGSWRGTYYSRGPIGFSGRWKTESGRVCVLPDAETIVAKWFPGWRCRTVWRGSDTSSLAIEYLDPRFASLEPSLVAVKDLPANNR